MKNRILYALLGLLTASVPTLAAAGELKREASVAFLEGPAWHPDGTVFFSDIPNNRIMRWSGKGAPKVHRHPSGHANGLVVDAEGRLVIAEDDGRLVRENLDGSIEVLAGEFGGKPFNALNDLALDSKGRIFFTDPRYLDRGNANQRDAQGNIIDAVYRLDTSGKVSRVLASEIDRPNGIVVSPGDQYLYVADNNGQVAGGSRKIWQFALDNAGDIVPGSQSLVFDWGSDRGPDGMTIDVQGNLYVAAGRNTAVGHQGSKVYKAGIYVISPKGDLLDFIAVPIDPVSNVTFGGNDLKTLFITAGHNLWSYPVETPGYSPVGQ